MVEAATIIDYSSDGIRDDRNLGEAESGHTNKSDDESSVDTQEAFLEMLGLTVRGDVLSMGLDQEEEDSSEGIPSQQICSTPIDLPRRCSRYLYPPERCAAFFLDHFYSHLECQELISVATTASTKHNSFQYITQATHTAPDGTSYLVQLQNPNPHKLSVFEHPPTLKHMWQLLVERAQILDHPMLKAFMNRTQCGPPLGLNPRLRVLRYDSPDNDRFEPHFDATTFVDSADCARCKKNKHQSLLTVLLYLNDGGGVDFEGGETLFLDSHTSTQQQRQAKIIPRAGKLVIFEHDLYHSGAPLISGTKYILRTDILFAAHEKGNCTALDVPVAEEGAITAAATADAGANADSKTDINLLSDLCTELNLCKQEKQILDDMGLLSSTIDAFLSPGIPLLKCMLEDGGMKVETIHCVIHTATRLVRS